ncbi:tyrosine-type recombinase/integrase [Nocardioides sp. P5_C9_2]
MTSKSKRADGRYQEAVTHDGKRHVFYGKTKAEARDKAADARNRIRSGQPVKDSSRTLGEWLDEWVAKTLKVSNRAESTKIRHEGDVRRWIKPTLGEIPLSKITPSDVAHLMWVMQEAKKAPSTRRNCYDVLSVALDDAMDNGLLAYNPANKAGRTRGRKAMRPTARAGEARFLRMDEAAGLMTGAAGLRYAEVLRLILRTGLRRGEALALRWEGIDLEAGSARVNGSLTRQNGSLILTGTKTKGSTRTISLDPLAVALLKAQKAAQAAERLKAGNIWQDTQGFVFTTALGAPVEPQNILRTVRIASTKAGIEGVKVHTLRHTYATTALRAGVPLKDVSVNLGHASTQLTADTYQHVTDEAARKAAEAVSAAYAAYGI